MKFRVLFYSILSVMVFMQPSSAADYREEFCSGDSGVCVLLEQNGIMQPVLKETFIFEINPLSEKQWPPPLF